MRFKRLLALILFFVSVPAAVLAQERPEVEAKLRQEPARYIQDGELFFSSFYEYSGVKQAGRKGQWRLFANTVGYAFANGFTPYLEVDSWDRFHNQDQLFNFGAYLKFRDFSSWHSEIGFGNDINYLPRFRLLEEYEHKLAGNLSWQAGFKYLHYPANHVYTVYPGLIYYFGDSYLSAFYNLSFTEGRGTAQSGLFKGSIALNKMLDFWFGGAVGQRLYDIDLLKASKQYGYFIFIGLDFKVTKNVKFRLGYSYGMEKPAFISRSVDYGVTIKF